MILMESLIMGVVEGFIGFTLGHAGVHAMGSIELTIGASEEIVVIIKMPPKRKAYGIVRALLLTLEVSIGGRAFPAYRASKIPSAVAPRYE